MSFSNPIDIYADGTKAVRVVEADMRRKALNIFAGTTPIWWGGSKTLQAGTIANKVEAGTNVEIKGGGEIWVRRLDGDSGNFGLNEEFYDGEV